MSLSGWGYDTSPQNVIWFCHLCQASFTLPLGTHHVCKPSGAPSEKGER